MRYEEYAKLPEARRTAAYDNMSVRDKIALLSDKIGGIEEKAGNRTLTAREAGIVAEIDQEIDNLRMELPANSPLSLVGPGGGHRTTGSDGPFRNVGEQLQAIRAAGIPGGQTDPRLFQAAATGLNETVPSEGGFLLQQDFSTQLLVAAFETGVLASRCQRIQISSNSNSIKLPAVDETSRATGSRWGGVRGYWLAEADEKQASKPKFRSLELALKKNVVLVYATDELLQDATALEGFIRMAAPDEIGFQVDDAIINGTGAGQPLGILNSGCLVSVSKETGQTAATVVFENISKMYARMPARNRKNAVWLVNQGIEPQLFGMSISVGTGGIPVYMPAGGVSGQPYGTLFGRPVIPIEQCAALGTVGDIIFADLSSYLLADKAGIESAMSIHVRFVYDESIFRFVYRVDGQPVLASSITPFDGGNALSPFVALAARA